MRHFSSSGLSPQRYGLGVVLRKAYPSFGNRLLGTGNLELVVRGAEVRAVPWKELPEGLSALVRWRAAEDPIVAAHVLCWPTVRVVDVPPESGPTVSENSRTLFPGRESAMVNDSTSTTAQLRAAGGEGHVSSTVVLLRQGAASRVRWFAPRVASRGFTFIERLVWLERGATLEYHGAAVGADALRETIHIVLSGEGATARVHTLFAGAGTHQFDFGVTAEHRAPHTTSDLRAKGTLGGKAQGIYRGLVRVAKNARGSDGYQRCDALLLSPTAEADPIPKLEIETNDVRCTHGVTVSHLNPEHLFYLQSRGLPEATARQVLVEGFAGTMLGEWPERKRESLREAVRSLTN